MGSVTVEHVFLAVIVALLVWITGGRIVMGLMALTRESERRYDVPALFGQAARAMAKQLPEQEVEELAGLLDDLQKQTTPTTYEALLLTLQARINDRLATSRRV
ncbi:MAG: hypothetical protein JXC32_12180 [Anaerolineae bacterium]|nr:hypothetical protein [Anaerolineae bacterium]